MSTKPRSLTELLAAKKAASTPAIVPTTDIVPAIQQEIKRTVGLMSLAERLALKRQAQEAAALASEPEQVLSSDQTAAPLEQTSSFEATPAHQETFALDITLNEKQLLSCEFTMAGKSHCLIGAAGTGKTTAQRAVAAALLKDSRLKHITYKIQGGSGERIPGHSIAFVAYTRRASANLQRAIHKDPALEKELYCNIMTIHALLEYEPEEYTEDGEERFRFVPRKDANNPLDITHLVIEEASMVGLDLWEKLFDALRPGVQIIFIGDINQLPPVFGSSILNYALVQLPVIELTQVYRQAEDSPIIHNAHRILKGLPIEEAPDFKIVRGTSPVQVGQGKMAISLGSMFRKLEEAGDYKPEEDIILSPFNKHDLGTDNMNKWVSQFLGEKRGAVVHEVIAGFNKYYLAVGDRVMVNKQDGYITKIHYNGLYHGVTPQPAGAELTRFGLRTAAIQSADTDSNTPKDLDDILLNYSNFSIEQLAEESSDRVQQASHVVYIKLETGATITLASAGDFTPQTFSLGYVLTVHKAQGCEWRKVFIILHKDHRVMLFRELLYTAVTRARESVVLIAKDDILAKAIASQRIKGNTLEEKIAFFNSGAVELGLVSCTK